MCQAFFLRSLRNPSRLEEFAQFCTALLLAFAVDLLLMVALGSFAAYQMSVMNEKASFVEARTIPSLGHVAQINSVINQYRVRQLEYLIYRNEADRDRALRQMTELEAAMDTAFADYRPLIGGDEERATFTAVEGAWRDLVNTNRERFIPSVSLSNTGSVQPFYSRMNPLYERLDLTMQRLSQVSRDEAESALGVVRGAYISARQFIIGDTLLTLVVSAGIGLVLAGRIAFRIGRLSSAAMKVADGDLDQRIVLSGNDEIATLGHHFNLMVESLRTQRGTLQQRNAALQASLAAQEQLMADLIRRKQAEEEAHRAQAAAEASSQAKSMFLATMSHELRTPLNAILGYAQVLRMTAAQRGLDEETAQQLDRILVAGRHLTSLITNVLDFSKIEQGKVDLQLSRFDVAALAREVVDVVQPLIQRNRNAIILICPPDIGLISSDAGKIRQILLNLLGNAAKFTENGVVTLRITRSEPDMGEGGGGPRLLPPHPYLLFEVSDTGIGIPVDQMDRLFLPFSQVDSSVTRRYEGTGLGLALTRQLCRLLGGEVAVSSEPGRGSTFTVLLPDMSVGTASDEAQLSAYMQTH